MIHRDGDWSRGGKSIGFDEQKKARLRELADRFAAQMAPQQPPTIAHRSCSFGAGAFWDHFTIQRNLTDFDRPVPTIAAHHQKLRPVIRAPGDPAGVLPATKTLVHGLKGRLPHEPQFTIGEGSGLLIVTGGRYGLDTELGRSSQNNPQGKADETLHQLRVAKERDLLKVAYLKGRPVIGICGGSWRVLESYGGTTLKLDANTHQARRMPFLTQAGNVSDNLATHDIDVASESLLGSLYADLAKDSVRRRAEAREPADNVRIPVNSVHWAAAREDRVEARVELRRNEKALDRVNKQRVFATRPDFEEAQLSAAKLDLLLVSARENGNFSRNGVVNEHVAAADRRRPMDSNQPALTDCTVEAFETRHGAPVVGIQWHPELYATSLGHDRAKAAAISRGLIAFMIKAGDAYEARRAMTAQFKRFLELHESSRSRTEFTTLEKIKAGPEIDRIFGGAATALKVGQAYEKGRRLVAAGKVTVPPEAQAEDGHPTFDFLLRAGLGQLDENEPEDAALARLRSE